MPLDERYDFRTIERTWQERWANAGLYRTTEDASKPKFYGLEFFPYPSGQGLSVGHFKNYAPNDAFLRLKSMQGFNVLHPMGWDAFGQPAENEAIKRQRQPSGMVREFAQTYKRQMQLIGLSYDWEREVNSSDPSYYHWTQWLFLLLYKRDLAYRKDAPVNWDPVDKTVLANEEVVNGRGWRSGALVEKRFIPQWYLKITSYADRLLADLDGLEWPDGIKNQQRNWIGRSEGAEVRFEVLAPQAAREEEALTPQPPHGKEALTPQPPLPQAGEGEPEGTIPNPRPLAGEGGAQRRVRASSESNATITVFTTRPDTLWGATFLVLAPEHPLVSVVAVPEQREAIAAYKERAQRQTDIDRQAEGREKTGVWTGAYATNPVNGKSIPIWVADYVLMGYGTGAIMAVPAHDQRDFEFARKFGLPIVPVYQEPGRNVSGDELARATTETGVLTGSGPFDGLPPTKDTASQVSAWLQTEGHGKAVITYKLRDWLLSRQRYWGVPIPIIHCPTHGEVPVPDKDLPVTLPDVPNYQPTGTGESPLAAIPEFVNTTCPICHEPARRETDTMAGFACSSWYFLRFADPRNPSEPFARAQADYWLPVDMYVGGAEHAVMHLLYARFWTKVMYDAGLVGFQEPFTRLHNQGMMLANTPGRRPEGGDEGGGEAEDKIEDWVPLKPDDAGKYSQDEIVYRWAKMSKSMGNVVTPDEAAEKYGADALRVYEMFVAPFEETVQWSEEAIRGSAKFLGRVYRLVAQHGPGFSANWPDKLDTGTDENNPARRALRRKTHQTMGKVADDLENFRFNTAVAALMEWVNVIADTAQAVRSEQGERSAALDEALQMLVLLLSPIAPHLTDELWTKGLGLSGFLYKHSWPHSDPEVAKEDEITLIVQVNGKVRDKIAAQAQTSSGDLEALALGSPRIQELLTGLAVRKVIVVPGKLVNIVAG